VGSPSTRRAERPGTRTGAWGTTHAEAISTSS
jgi:hypothetical protein